MWNSVRWQVWECQAWGVKGFEVSFFFNFFFFFFGFKIKIFCFFSQLFFSSEFLYGSSNVKTWQPLESGWHPRKKKKSKKKLKKHFFTLYFLLFLHLFLFSSLHTQSKVSCWFFSSFFLSLLSKKCEYWYLSQGAKVGKYQVGNLWEKFSRFSSRIFEGFFFYNLIFNFWFCNS